MPPRRRSTYLLLFLMGSSWMLTIACGYVATSNFKVTDVDRLRNADAVFADIPPGTPRRLALRYVASELNRHLFALYGPVSAGLLVLCLLVAVIGGNKSRAVFWMLGVCAAGSIVFTVYFTPELVETGRAIDFLPRDPMPPEVKQFYRLHGASLVVEGLKLVLLPIAAVLVTRRSARTA